MKAVRKNSKSSGSKKTNHSPRIKAGAKRHVGAKSEIENGGAEVGEETENQGAHDPSDGERTGTMASEDKENFRRWSEDLMNSKYDRFFEELGVNKRERRVYAFLSLWSNPILSNVWTDIEGLITNKKLTWQTGVSNWMFFGTLKWAFEGSFAALKRLYLQSRGLRCYDHYERVTAWSGDLLAKHYAEIAGSLETLRAHERNEGAQSSQQLDFLTNAMTGKPYCSGPGKYAQNLFSERYNWHRQHQGHRQLLAYFTNICLNRAGFTQSYSDGELLPEGWHFPPLNEQEFSHAWNRNGMSLSRLRKEFAPHVKLATRGDAYMINTGWSREVEQMGGLPIYWVMAIRFPHLKFFYENWKQSPPEHIKAVSNALMKSARAMLGLPRDPKGDLIQE